jgi:hypothetical protein
MKKNNLLIGLILSALVCGIIICSIEKNISLPKIFIGFIIFIFPSIFITSFQSKLTVFIISSITIILGFISYKFQIYDIWIGVLEALIIGRVINYYRIRN